MQCLFMGCVITMKFCLKPWDSFSVQQVLLGKNFYSF